LLVARVPRTLECYTALASGRAGPKDAADDAAAVANHFRGDRFAFRAAETF